MHPMPFVKQLLLLVGHMLPRLLAVQIIPVLPNAEQMLHLGLLNLPFYPHFSYTVEIISPIKCV